MFEITIIDINYYNNSNVIFLEELLSLMLFVAELSSELDNIYLWS